MILDTDVLIDLEQGTPESKAWFDGLSETPSVAGYAALEFLAGCENAADRRRIERHLRPFTYVWPDDVTLNEAIESFGELRLRYGLGVLDMLIAATALHHLQELATFNSKHFRSVPGLVTLQPYVR
jgi:predicted nucleic acid-binding protein